MVSSYILSNVAIYGYTALQPGIGRTDQNIPIENSCPDDDPHNGLPAAATLTKMMVTIARNVMLSAPPAGNDGLQLNSRGLTKEPVMPMGLSATMAIMWVQMWQKKLWKMMID